MDGLYAGHIIISDLPKEDAAAAIADLKRSGIRKTENYEVRTPKVSELVGKRVLHPIFGEGSVIGTPRDQEGVIVQFDTVVTPRTFGPGAKITYLT